MVDVRTAVPADAAEIARVHTVSLRHYGADHYDEEQLKYLAPTDAKAEDVSENLLADGHYAAVAEINGNVVGFGGLRLQDGALLGFFVDPEYGGEGVGTALFEHIEERARTDGLATITVFAALNAVEFYKACGLERVGERNASGAEGPVGTYESGALELPAVEMRKSLPTS